MSIVRIENIPQAWNDEYDVPFFTIVARIFSTEFTYGAGVLLAGNADLDDSTPAVSAVTVVPVSAPSALVPATPLTAR